VPRAAGDRVFVVAGDCVRELPAHDTRSPGSPRAPHVGPRLLPTLHCD
jgi:hypothetical protein